MRLTRNRMLVALVAALTMGAVVLTTTPASASSNAATARVTNALAHVTAGLVAQAVPSTKDGDSAAQTATVDVPVDPAQGVKVKTNDGQTMTIGLPDAAHLKNGIRTAAGVVVYHNPNGSDEVVVPLAHGVQFLTVIENADAPTDYAYPTATPQGGTIRLARNGSALLLDSTGKPVSVIAAPWARGGGETVPTSFSTDGKTLTQHIAHKAGVGYPVVADPSLNWYWDGIVVTLSRGDMATVMYGGSQALVPMLMLPGIGWGVVVGVLWVAGNAAWAYYNHKCAWFWLPYIGWGSSMGWYNC